MSRNQQLFVIAIVAAISTFIERGNAQETWSVKLGYPADRRVLILHADDIGMCFEANYAAKRALEAGNYRSAAAMVPCPWFYEFVDWAKKHPDVDVGLHLAMTAEWSFYRWGPVAPRDQVKGMIDSHGFLHDEVQAVAISAKPEEIEREIRAQIQRSIDLGLRPGHIDTHMGTLYARPEFTAVYLKAAIDFHIPAMVIEATDDTVRKFRAQGYPFNDKMVKLIREYPLPKLDNFHSIQHAKTYDEKRTQAMTMIREMKPGLHEMIFHPSLGTECLKRITGSWQQRIWEDQLWSDPEVRKFLEEQKIILSDWKEVMRRFDGKNPTGR